MMMMMTVMIYDDLVFDFWFTKYDICYQIYFDETPKFNRKQMVMFKGGYFFQTQVTFHQQKPVSFLPSLNLNMG